MKGCLPYLILTIILFSIYSWFQSCQNEKKYNEFQKNIKKEDEARKANRTQDELLSDSLYALDKELSDKLDKDELKLDISINTHGSKLSRTKVIAIYRLNLINTFINDFKIYDSYDNPYQIISQIEECKEHQRNLIKLNIFKIWDDSLSKSIKNCENRFIKLVSTKMPEIRRIWIKTLNAKLWEKDYEINCIDKSCKTATFINGKFLLNKNKKEFMEDYETDFSLLRFKRINLKAYDGEGTFNYWNINSKQDNEL